MDQIFSLSPCRSDATFGWLLLFIPVVCKILDGIATYTLTRVSFTYSGYGCRLGAGLFFQAPVAAQLCRGTVWGHWHSCHTAALGSPQMHARRPISTPMADSGTSAYNRNPGGKNQYPPCHVTVLLSLLNTITIYGCTITAGVNDLTLVEALQRYH